MTSFDTVHEALVTKGDIFAGRSHLPPDIYLQRNVETGVTISDGEKWRTQRRFSVKMLRELGMGKNRMEAQINELIDELMQMLRETNDVTKPFDICKPLQQFAGNVTHEVLFGNHFKYSEAAKFEFLLEQACTHLRNIQYNVAALLIQAWPWTKSLPVIWRKGYKEPMDTMSKFNDFIEEEVEKIENSYDRNLEPTNFVEAYLSGMETNGELEHSGQSLCRRGGCMVRRYFGISFDCGSRDSGRKRQAGHSDAALAELQRYSNILPFILIHRCTADTTIAGKSIPKDTLTRHQIFSVMMDKEIFEDPTEFRPERFLGVDGKLNNMLLEYVFPFGMGKRQCMGEGLARMELFLILGNLLLNYRFEATEPLDSINQVDRDPGYYKCRVVPICTPRRDTAQFG